jgi:hypothetical protein
MVSGVDEFLTNDSEDSTGRSTPHRVRIPAFTLTFFPMPVATLTTTQASMIEELAEDILHNYFPTKVSHGITVDYVDLLLSDNWRRSDRHNRRHLKSNTADHTAVLKVSGGLASFRGGAPTVDEVNAWVSEALQGQLLELLQQETELNDVDSIVFTSLTPAPTPSPSQEQAISASTSGQMDQPVTNHSFAVAGGIVGLVALASVTLVALLSWRRRSHRRRSAPVEPILVPMSDGATSKSKAVPTARADASDDQSEEEDDNESRGTSQNLRDGRDAESVSASEWTMSTNATDAYTVQSGKVFPRISHSLMQTESFERDRQVSLRKDMLQASWSTAIPYDAGLGKGGVGGSDNLLTPSHFSVHESPSGDSYEGDSAWNPDDTEMTLSGVDHDSPFVFQAQGDDVVLMPPSRVRTTRRGGGGGS